MKSYRKELHFNTKTRRAYVNLKRSVMGREVVVAVTNGRLDFGTWETGFPDPAANYKKVLVNNF